MKTERIMNGFCKGGQHAACPAKSKGSKSDPVNFVCICECHIDGVKIIRDSSDASKDYLMPHSEARKLYKEGKLSWSPDNKQYMEKTS